MIELVLNPNTEDEERVPINVCEGNIDDAINIGRAEASSPLAEQIIDTAYHMILEGDVSKGIFVYPWVMQVNGKNKATNDPSIPLDR